MTVSLAQLNANTNTFGDWLFRTNEISNTISTVVVTVDSSSPPSGNAVVNGAIEATTIYVDTIYGGDISNTQNLSISSNTTFTANVTFSGNTVSYGDPSRHQYTLANATHYHLVANTASGRLRLGKGLLLDETNPSGNLIFHEQNVIVQANASLIIEGITGPENLRDSINTIKEDILNLAIALG